MMDLQRIARRIKEKGNELGLGAVGIASVALSDHAAFLDDWLRRGFAGEMGYMGRTAGERVDPAQRFPWVRSAVVAAVPYLPYQGDRRTQEGLVKHVARYAAGRDYHRVLGERLAALARFIQTEAPSWSASWRRAPVWAGSARTPT